VRFPLRFRRLCFVASPAAPKGTHGGVTASFGDKTSFFAIVQPIREDRDAALPGSLLTARVRLFLPAGIRIAAGDALWVDHFASRPHYRVTATYTYPSHIIAEAERRNT